MLRRRIVATAAVSTLLVGFVGGYTTPAQAAPVTATDTLRSGLGWAFGSNDKGQTVPTSTSLTTLGAKQLPNGAGGLLSDAVSIAAGKGFALWVDHTGTVWSIGDNVYSQSGSKSIAVIDRVPVRAEGFGGSGQPKAVKVSAYGLASTVLDNSGSVWQWGNVVHANGSNTVVSTPEKMTFPVGTGRIVDISSGEDFSLALDDTGAAYAWGKNDRGQLGTGTTNTSPAPTKVPGLPLLVGGATASLEAGRNFAIYAVSGAAGVTLYSWGAGDHYQLGTGPSTADSRSPQLLPKTVPAPAKVVALSSGGAHTLLLTSDGGLLTWGDNGLTASPVPTAVADPGGALGGSHKPYTVAAGDGASFVASTDGTIAAWGVDTTGQLGRTTTGTVSAPTLITVPGTTPAADAGVPALITSRQGATYVVVDSEITRGADLSGYVFPGFPTSPAPGQSAPSRLFTFTNVATRPLTISSFGMEGAQPTDFALSGSTCAGTLALDASCSVTVTFRPTAVGARSANLALKTTNTYGGTALQTLVPLSGRAYAAVPGLANLTLDLAAASPTTVSGPGNVIPLNSLAPSLIPASTPPDATASLGRISLGRISLGRISLGRISLGRISLGRIPIDHVSLGRISLGRISLGRIPLPSLGRISLGRIPLLREGGWTGLLAAYPQLRDLPISSLTLADLLDPAKNKPDPALTDALPLDRVALSDLAVSASSFANISVMSVLTGNLRLDQFGGVDWCADLPQIRNGGSCTAGAGLRRVLLELDLQGVSMDETRVGAVTVGQLVTDSLSTTSSPLDEAIFPSILLNTVTLPGTRVGAIALSSIPNISLVLDCAQADCVNLAGRTLGDVPKAHLRTDATFRELGTALNPITMAQLVEPFMDRASFDWESLPTSLIPLAAYPNRVTEQVDVDVNCLQSTGLSLGVKLPAGFQYVPGTTTLARTRGTGNVPLPDPTVDAVRGYIVNVPDSSFSSTGPIACVDDSAHVSVSLGVLPTGTAGSYRATADARATSVPALAATQTRALTVTGINEPPSDSPDGPKGAADQLILGKISAPGKPAYIPFDAPADKVIEVTISAQTADLDGVLYYPKGASLDAALSPVTPVTQVPFGEAASVEPDALHRQLTTYGGALQDIPLLTDRPVAAVAATRGLDVEQLSAVARVGTDSRHLLAVTGYNRAIGSFMARIRLLDAPALASCTAVPVTPGVPASTPFYKSTGYATGDNTVVVVNTSKLIGKFGTVDALRVLDAAERYVHGGKGGVRGQVLQVDAYASVRDAQALADASPCDKTKSNGVVRAINDALASAPTSIRYYVLGGGQELLTHACLDDATRDGNEREEAGELALTGGNSIASCFAGGGYLSDHPYGTRRAMAVLGQVIYLPQGVTARVGESADEMVSQFDTFVANDGVADPRTQSTQPRTALVADYDFLTSGGTGTAAALSAAGHTVDHSLTNQQPPWTKADLDAAWLNKAGGPPALAALNMHYDQYRGLPALGNATGDQSQLYTAAQVSASTAALARRVVFTVGCHSALDVPDSYADASTAERARTFSQAYAGKGLAVMIGNLGFGYADSTTLAYSAQKQVLFAQGLAKGYDVGTAQAEADRLYLSRLAGLSAYDLKSLQETIVWGPPQYRLTSSPAVLPSGPTFVTGTQDPRIGLQTTTVQVGTSDNPLAFATVNDGSSTHRTAVATDPAVADRDPHTVAVPGRPVLAAQFVDLPQVAGQVVRSVVPTALTSTALTPVTATFAKPAVDHGQAPEPQSVGVFPATLGHVGTALSATGTTNTLVVTPTQMIAKGTAPGAFDLRAFPSSQWQAIYGPAGDSRPDTITYVAGASVPASGNTPASTTYTVQVQAAAGAVTKRVYVLALPESGIGDWVLTELSADSTVPGRYVGGSVGRLGEFLAIAINDRGDAALSNLKGGGWVPQNLGPAGDELSHLHLSSATPASGWYTSDPALTVDAPYTALVDGKAVASPYTFTGDGVHLVQLQRTDGTLVPGGVSVLIDTVVPQVTLAVADASRFELKEDVPFSVAVTYGPSGQKSLVDTGRAYSGGRALVTDSVGAKTLTVTATSVAGLSSTATKAYQVVYGKGSTGFLSPIAAPPTLNITTRNLTYSFSYHLLDHFGADVTSGAGTGNPAPQYVTYACPTATGTLQSPKLSGATAQPVYQGGGIWQWDLTVAGDPEVAVCKHLTVTTNDAFTTFKADLRILP